MGDTMETQASQPTLYMTKDAFAGSGQLIALGHPRRLLAWRDAAIGRRPGRVLVT